MPRDPKQAVKKTTQAQKKVTPVAKEKPAPVVEKESKPQTQPKSAPQKIVKENQPSKSAEKEKKVVQSQPKIQDTKTEQKSKVAPVVQKEKAKETQKAPVQKAKETAKPQPTKVAPKAAPVAQKETKAEKEASKVVQKVAEPAKPAQKEKVSPKTPPKEKEAPKAQKESPKAAASPKVATQNPTPEKKAVQESPKSGKKASPAPKSGKKEKEVPMEVEQKVVKKTETKKGKKAPEPAPVEPSTESDSNEEEMDVEVKPVIKTLGQAGGLEKKQVQAAAKSLLDYKKSSKRKSPKTPLFDEGEPVQLMISLGKLDQDPIFKRYCIPVPHPVRENAEVCVIVKDPVKKYKPMVKDIPGVSKVIGIEKLRTHFKQFESRRKLQRSYDIFVCDADIFLLMKGLLGKAFIESKQVPYPVRFNGHLQQNITKIRNGAILNVSTGLQLNVQIGLTSYTPEQLAANVMKARPTLAKKLGGWENIQCLSLKTVDSPALPFFNQITFSV